MIRWALNQNEEGKFKGVTKNASIKDFISSCLIARQNHPELESVVNTLFYEVANMGRSKRKSEQRRDNSIIVELFIIVLPQYFEKDRKHVYLDLMYDILESQNFQYEMDRIDKQHLLFKMVDMCMSHMSIINSLAENNEHG